ncbi:active breakpoint cluster region-related protein-like isoform X3 [Penaeus chinensis]|uniref:active breakpoint cluster region-related protein-like isoform X3 n=1 Tax=Penaeus chinensis TaxID=139456 RepID=UPI001FB6EBFB|nr:active breakpoint cluster region-related protein-like isoform X3 [Penaeus chinensis]
MATEPRDETCAVRDFMHALRFAGADEDEEKSHAAVTAKSILGTSDGQGAHADSGGEHEGGEASLEGCQATGINLGEATGASMAAEAGGGGGEQDEAEAAPEAGCQAAGLMTLEVRRGSKTSAFDDDEDEYVEYDSDSSIETFFPRSESTDDIIAIIREQENEEQGEEDDQPESPEASLSPGASVEAKGSLGVRRRMAFREPRKTNLNFRKKARGRPVQRSDSVESDEDEMPNLLRSISSDHEDEVRDEALDIDSGVYGSSVESTSHMPSAPPTPPTAARWASADLPEQPKSSPAAEAERMTMYRCIISSIVESETIYLECLDVVLQYMKALKATLTTSQPVISPDDFSTVFYRISELHAAHSAFLQGLRERSSELDGSGTIGEHFRDLASKLDVYASFLQNYPRAIETVRRCSSQSPQFADITRSIKLRSLQGQPQSLEDLLHRPVARVQKNALVLHDLLKYTSENHPDHETLKEALKLTQNFLTHLSMIHTEAMFPAQDRPQRHLVRNSFIVELVEGHRKLRHLFLFNDVIVCAKYKVSGAPTGRSEKFTFEVKWYISLHDIAVLNDSGPETLKESNPPNLVSLKSQASTIRDQLRRIDNMGEKGASRMNQARNEKHRKKLAELEAQLVLASPNLPFRISKRAGPVHTFLLTSEYERDQWGEAIQVLQANTPGVGGSSLTLHELQGWITAYRSFLKTNMGSFLLKSGRDDSLLLGDLHIVVSSLHGLTRPAKMFVCFEVDSYGHFFRKVKTKQAEGVEPHWNQDFIIELEGSQTLRILCYEEDPKLGVQLRGKAHLELSRSWLSDTLNERRVSLQDLVLVLSLKFLPPEATLRRVPTGKSSGLFGTNIANVCKREKRSVPFIVTRCVREVERRGMQEVGIYRVSGLASDITKLKKSFESNPYEAEQLVKEVDIHSVTGLLKLFLRELPEALFTDELYPRFFEAYSAADPEYRKTTILKLFSSLPQLNQSIIAYLLEHLVKVHQMEHQNKMSLHNLATVFGPTLIRPGAKAGNPSPAEQLAAGTVDVMAQAGILHFFLTRRAHGEPIQGVNQ